MFFNSCTIVTLNRGQDKKFLSNSIHKPISILSEEAVVGQKLGWLRNAIQTSMFLRISLPNDLIMNDTPFANWLSSSKSNMRMLMFMSRAEVVAGESITSSESSARCSRPSLISPAKKTPGYYIKLGADDLKMTLILRRTIFHLFHVW